MYIIENAKVIVFNEHNIFKIYAKDLEEGKLKFEDINVTMLLSDNIELLKNTEFCIFKYKGQYKVLKSRI